MKTWRFAVVASFLPILAACAGPQPATGSKEPPATAVAASVEPLAAAADPCAGPSFEPPEYSPLVLRPKPNVAGKVPKLAAGSFSKRTGETPGCGCDIAVAFTAEASPTHDFLLLKRGNDDGTFSHLSLMEIPENPRALVAGRFTVPDSEDRRAVPPDLDALAVVTGSSGQRGKVTLFVPRERDGTIKYQNSGLGPWEAGINTPRAGIVAGEFNRDDHLDIAVAGKDDLTILFGNATGGFTIGQAIAIPEGVPVSLAAGDFTGPGGKDDIAIGIDLKSGSNTRSAVMVVGWDDQTGQIKRKTEQPIIVGDLGTNATIVASANLSRPGDASGQGGVWRDLVVGYTNPGSGISGTVKLLPGQDHGLFLPVESARTLGIGGTPKSVTVTHIDQDNFVDLVMSTHGSSASAEGTIQLFQGKGGSLSDIGFHAVEGWKTIPAKRPRSVVAFKLGPKNAAAGSRRMVLAAANDDRAIANPDSVSFFVGGGDGVFVEPPLVATKLPEEVSLLTAGQFTSTETANVPLDFAGLEKKSEGKNVLSVWLGNGAGSFALSSQPAENPSQIFLGANPALIAVGKLDSDAMSDIAVIDIAVNPGTGGAIMRTFKGEGRGEFAPLSSVNVIVLPAGEKPVAVAAAPFIGQGAAKPHDIAVLSDTTAQGSTQASGKLTIWINEGNGKFRKGPETNLRFRPGTMVVSDKFRAGEKYDVVITSIGQHPDAARKFTFWINIGDHCCPN